MSDKKRLISLDVLRGITVAGMILVNNAGGPDSYAPLKHAVWNGLTVCDLVFPFFLFIMGISTYISLSKFDFQSSRQVALKVVRRTLIIILIGWAINWFYYICKGNFFAIEQLRLTGVLTRIGLCYGIVSLIALYVNHKYLLSIIIGLLVGYAVLLLCGNGYLADETNLLSIIDRKLIGIQHLYLKRPIDPEGLTSTLPAIAHTLIGFYCGLIIIRIKNIDQKVLHLLLVGFILISIGWLLSFGMPLNKRIWSPSFTLLTCGAASSLLAFLMYFIDIKEKKSWCTSFLIFGVNPLFLYILSEVLAILFSRFAVKAYIYNALLGLIREPYMASAVYALLFTIMLGATGYILYRKRIYIKIG